MAPAEQQPCPNLEPCVVRAEDESRLYLRERLLVHARTLQQLAQEEPSGETVLRERGVVVKKRRSRLGTIAEKRIKVEGTLGRDQPGEVLRCKQ